MLWHDGGRKTPPLLFCGCVRFEREMNKAKECKDTERERIILSLGYSFDF
jgi:hypothetical protein